MKVKKITHFILGLILGLYGNLSSQPVFVNTQWAKSHGNPGSHSQVSSQIAPNGNLFVLSNQLQGQNTRILLTCLASDGTQLWQQTNPGQATTGQNVWGDYGVDLALDAGGNVYTCGAQHNGQNYDYLVTKYSPTGAFLWQKVMNGSGNGDDIPAAIETGPSGQVFVTGTSFGNSSLQDMVTLCLSEINGQIVWLARYDLNNKEEEAVDLGIDSNGDILVCGNTAQNTGDADFVLLKYSAANGFQIAAAQHASPGAGLDRPSEMVISAANQYYLVGTAYTDLPDKDIKLIAFSKNMQVLWAKYLNHAGGADEGAAICLDPGGNPVITGHFSKPGGGSDLVVGKFKGSNGAQMWMHNRTALVDQEIAQGHKITVDAAGNLYATGEVDQKGSHNFITLALDGGGTLRWEKLWNSPGSGQDAGRAIQISGKAVYVSGNSYGAASTTTTVKYLQKEKNDAIIYSSNGDPAFAAHDLIVRLDTSAIIRAAVNNRGFEAGTLDDFVKPGPAAQLRAAIAALCQSANCDISVFKIFRQLRTDDVSTVSRLGDTIPIPHFWATLLFEFPPAVDVAHAADSLNALFPLVKYTQPNVAIGLNSVNDPLYIEQSSLHPTPHNDTAHINVEPAWALETGKRFVKAGVFDSGIKWNHEDFGDGTANGTKVEGWNFETNSNLKSLANNDNLNHGTPVAGIIGAIRNNNKGVAGIAGGNDPTGTNLDSAGVSLFGMKILDGWFFGYVVLNYVADAMVTSCIDDPTKDYAYGLHVQSHSWHIHEGFDIYFTDTNLTLLSNTSKITSTNQFSFLVFI